MYFRKDFVYFRNYFKQFLRKILCIRGNILGIIFGNISFISKNIWCVINERFFVFHKSILESGTLHPGTLVEPCGTPQKPQDRDPRGTLQKPEN